MIDRHQVGKEYETAAAAYFRKKGYRILEQNFHAGRYGEIDLIMEDTDQTLVFCECKYRKDHTHGSPLEAVDGRKQRKISQTALFYLARKGWGMDRACRFDVIAMDGKGAIWHIPDAFEFQEK